MFRIISKIVIFLCGFIFLVIILILGMMMITEFRPPKTEVPEITGNARPMDTAERTFTFFSWNIGYAGLNSGSDFFYDGGKMVIPPRTVSGNNLKAIVKTVSRFDSVDFLFFQEVDRNSKRSWEQDQYRQLAAVLPGYTGIFSKNHDCNYIPVPFGNPTGKVYAGLAEFSKYQPQFAETNYFDVFFPWPKRMVFLKRCFTTLKYRLNNQKQLVIINVHNSAYDSAGSLRRRELFMIDSVMQTEYHKGNYVVAGGDWNTIPPGFDPTRVHTGDAVMIMDAMSTDSFFRGFAVVYDPLNPSNRNLNMPYIKGKTLTTTIDFFIISPNIDVMTIKTLRHEFRWSDHEPVYLKVRLNG